MKHTRGQAMIELIASLIILTMLFVLSANFSVYLYVAHVFTSAAREGARTASLNRDLVGANSAVAEGKVIAVVKNYIQSTSGITIADTDVTITPPDATAVAGERQVMVEVDYTMTMPVNAAALITAFGGSGEGLDQLPVHGSAVMRYEE